MNQTRLTDKQLIEIELQISDVHTGECVRGAQKLLVEVRAQRAERDALLERLEMYQSVYAELKARVIKVLRPFAAIGGFYRSSWARNEDDAVWAYGDDAITIGSLCNAANLLKDLEGGQDG